MKLKRVGFRQPPEIDGTVMGALRSKDEPGEPGCFLETRVIDGFMFVDVSRPQGREPKRVLVPIENVLFMVEETESDIDPKSLVAVLSTEPPKERVATIDARAREEEQKSAALKAAQRRAEAAKDLLNRAKAMTPPKEE